MSDNKDYRAVSQQVQIQGRKDAASRPGDEKLDTGIDEAAKQQRK